jgi:hypothetical protein
MQKFSKLIGFLIVALLFNACGTLFSSSSTTSSNSSSYTAGQSSGTALKALYAQYQADGKVDMGKVENLINIVSLVNNVKTIKNAEKSSGAYTDFVQGMVSGSSNLVNELNAETVMNGLRSALSSVDTSKIDTAVEKGTSAVQSASAIATSVSEIMSLFK